ncbi:hypothetical protein ACFOQM_10540 [Paenibacillus sp. GCM10012307]|uniref:Uncharacterized protein n=1 Tax=Paenibacillus roseus TaxID=2798579 RepID=A0A934ML27_9BACL|nr:hypothetical protein [Paenibacillus roseus]MBJ6361720.1 hypothetical protein [Paenibacillus roseus]
MEGSMRFVAFPAEVLYPGGGNKRQYDRKYNHLMDECPGCGFGSLDFDFNLFASYSPLKPPTIDIVWTSISNGRVAFPAEVLYPGGGNKRQYDRKYNHLQGSVPVLYTSAYNEGSTGLPTADQLSGYNVLILAFLPHEPSTPPSTDNQRAFVKKTYSDLTSFLTYVQNTGFVKK